MTVTVDLPDVALETLDAKLSNDAVDGLGPAAVMKLYALGRPFASVVAESAGKGRVEFMDRLSKYGGVFWQTRGGLMQPLGSGRSLRG
jgi:hypothetical protein